MNIIPVTSLDDPRLADYRGVKERQLAAEFGARGCPGLSHDAPFGKFYVEGDKVLHHLVRQPCDDVHAHRPLSVLCTSARLDATRDDLERMPPGTPVYVAPQSLMDGVIGFNIHRGLLGVGARGKPRTIAQLLALVRHNPGPLVVMEDLSNHDNIGSIFRSAAAFGVAGVILSPSCADPFYRKALRVSVGLVLKVPFTVMQGWPHDLSMLHDAGYTTLATTPSGEVSLESALEQSRAKGRRPAIMIGAEGPGLTPQALAAAIERVRIDMAPGVDSLNAGVASAICLYVATVGVGGSR